jgi:lipopolysaccharide/colanic/teichoic acid biosynthesis glycosyltransferase
VEKVSGHYLTYFNNDIQYGSKYILKRSVDILLSVVLIVSFSPVLLLTFLYILYLDGYPIILKQNRVGLHGADFKMFKFRTMKNNSHSLREELNELNKNDAAIFKIDKDPRIIKGAEFLRKFSIDELPQLWNVLFGQMSIVGPRPLFTEDTQLFDKNYMRRLNVLPGITGLLQINERNTSNFSTWYKYDIEYIENWSIYLDFKIMIKTPFALFGKKIKGL